jgi:hypothetical protein
MRPAPWRHLDRYRIVFGEMASPLGATYGAFRIPRPQGGLTLAVIASDGDAAAAGLSADYAWVPKTDHRNLHPNCLHLWKPVGVEIPRPPSDTVA